MIELYRVNKDFCGKTLLNFRIIPIMFALTLLEIDSICFSQLSLLSMITPRKVVHSTRSTISLSTFKSKFLKICLNLRVFFITYPSIWKNVPPFLLSKRCSKLICSSPRPFLNCPVFALISVLFSACIFVAEVRCLCILFMYWKQFVCSSILFVTCNMMSVALCNLRKGAI